MNQTDDHGIRADQSYKSVMINAGSFFYTTELPGGDCLMSFVATPKTAEINYDLLFSNSLPLAFRNN